MALKELSDGNPSGTRLGQSSTDKLGFFGLATPIVQPTSANEAAVATTTITAVATTAAAASGNGYGFTQAVADGIVTGLNATIARQALLVTLVNQLRSDLVALGVIKGS